MLFSWSAVPEGIAREGNAELPRVWCNLEIKIALIRVSEVLDQGPRPTAIPCSFSSPKRTAAGHGHRGEWGGGRPLPGGLHPAFAPAV